MSPESLVTPLGHSFTHKEVILRKTPNVSLVLMDVSIEAFTQEWGNIGGDGESTFVTYDYIYEVLCILRSRSVTILIPSIHTVVFLVAIPLNIMVIVMFLVKMKVGKPAVVYMLNLAIADVLLVCVLPFYIVYRFLGNNWIFGEGMCRFVTVAYYCNIYCSVLLMTSISMDRFLAVVYPVRSLPWRTVTRAWLVCGAIWVISLANTVPFLIEKQTWDSGRDITLCHDIQHLGFYFYFSYDYFPTVFSLFNFLPLLIITFCYIGIIRSLSRSAFDRRHKRSRSIRLSVIVLSVFVLCFGPNNVICLIHYKQMFKNYGLSLYIANITSSSIISINCCLDPLIYYFASSECQRYVSSLLRWKRNDRPPVHIEQVPLRTHPAQLTKSE
ncbi:proteinase-activated receptor 1-like [Lithobates pipiens]